MRRFNIFNSKLLRLFRILVSPAWEEARHQGQNPPEPSNTKKNLIVHQTSSRDQMSLCWSTSLNSWDFTLYFTLVWTWHYIGPYLTLKMLENVKSTYSDGSVCSSALFNELSGVYCYCCTSQNATSLTFNTTATLLNFDETREYSDTAGPQGTNKQSEFWMKSVWSLQRESDC